MGAEALGVALDEKAQQTLVLFLDELERWNARLNLVGEHDRESLADRHLVDSLAAAPIAAALGADLRIADLGSGAGLPGVPLAVALASREMLLVEPRRKRASFLRAIRRALPDLGLSIEERRAEDLPPALAASFDVIVSRAALADDELAKAARPLLRAGGLLIAYRGNAPQPLGNDSADDGFGAALVHRYDLPSPRRSFSLVVRERSSFT